MTQWKTICLPSKRCGLIPWVGKIPWRRKWQTIPVFLPGKFHRQRRLEGYSHGISMGWTWFSDSTIKIKIKAFSPGKESKYRENLLFRECVCVLLTLVCLTLCNPTDWSSPGSSIHGTFQARILKWVSIPFSSQSSWPRDQTQVSSTAGRLFYHLSH